MTDTRPYTLTVDGFDDGYFVVQAFRGREAISETYAFEIVVTAPAGSSDQVEQTALGQTATFVWNLPGGDGVAPRAFYCVVAAVRVHGVRGVERIPQFEIRVVPRLWLLKRKRNTRIFQNMRVPDVVTRVLAETGISTRWQLSRTYPVREYVTQYEESDLAFVERLLAEAGILFYFPEGGPVSDLVFTIASIADKAGATAGSLVGSVAGSAAGALVTDAVSAATPIIPGDTLVGTDDAQFYPPLGASDAAALEASTFADLAPGGRRGGRARRGLHVGARRRGRRRDRRHRRRDRRRAAVALVPRRVRRLGDARGQDHEVHAEDDDAREPGHVPRLRPRSADDAVRERRALQLAVPGQRARRDRRRRGDRGQRAR